jgi:hypothetical protein
MGRMSASVKRRNSGVTTAPLALAQRRNMTMNTSDTGHEQRPIYMLDEADLEAVTGGSVGFAAAFTAYKWLTDYGTRQLEDRSAASRRNL